MSIFGKKPVQPAKPKRTQAELNAEAAKLAARLGRNVQPRPATKEDKIRDMIQNDPEKAAALIREMFLKGK